MRIRLVGQSVLDIVFVCLARFQDLYLLYQILSQNRLTNEYKCSRSAKQHKVQDNLFEYGLD